MRSAGDVRVMEMTLQRLGLENYRPLLKGLVMPIGILALVAMMVLPLPVVLLDTFFVSNILVSLLVLMSPSTRSARWISPPSPAWC